MADTRQLMDAVKKKDLQSVNVLLKNGADVNARDPQTGLTVLMTAAGLGHAAIVKDLLAYGADVHRVDGRAGATALHKACLSGSIETVKLLVEAGSLVNLQTSSTGHTPLIDAIWYGNIEITEYLLSVDTALNLNTSYGFTLDDHINYALKTNSSGKESFLAIQRLVAERRERDKTTKSPLMAAVLTGDIEGVRRAVKEGADLEYKAPILNGFNDGYTPLLVAAREGHAEIVRELLKAGANPNATDAVFLAVPLHKATYHGYREVTEILAKHPGVDLDFPGGSNGYTPLHDALWHGYADCARVLVDAGASLTIRAHDGTNAMDIAVKTLGPDHEIVRYIRGKMKG